MDVLRFASLRATYAGNSAYGESRAFFSVRRQTARKELRTLGVLRFTSFRATYDPPSTR
jgi:hypothetical protein